LEKREEISYITLIRFFIPLGILPMLIALNHTATNSALARLPKPELNIAIFTVVKSITGIINAPAIMSRQLFASVVDNAKSFLLTTKFAWSIITVLAFLIFLLPITPAGEYILIEIMGLTPGLEVTLALNAFFVTFFLPFVVLFRNMFHGMLTALKNTKLILPGTFFRLFSLAVILWWAVETQKLSGVMAGSISWVFGIFIEGMFVYYLIRKNYGKIINTTKKMPKKNIGSLNIKSLFKFYLPLSLMISLTMFFQPLIQSGIARSFSPVRSLAVYGLTWTMITFFIGPLKMLNQLPIVYVEKIKSSNWTKVRNFSIFVGLLITIVIILFSLSSFGEFILINLIGVSKDIAKRVQFSALSFSLFPLVRSFREPYWGVLMNRQKTNLIGTAKTVNLFILSAALVIGFGYINPIMVLEPAFIGGLAFTVGEITESLIIYYYTS